MPFMVLAPHSDRSARLTTSSPIRPSFSRIFDSPVFGSSDRTSRWSALSVVSESVFEPGSHASEVTKNPSGPLISAIRSTFPSSTEIAPTWATTPGWLNAA